MGLAVTKEDFVGLKDYWFNVKICRAAVSIYNHIASGSNRTTIPELSGFRLLY
jgi:hypothetical protein